MGVVTDAHGDGNICEEEKDPVLMVKWTETARRTKIWNHHEASFPRQLSCLKGLNEKRNEEEISKEKDELKEEVS